jgi:hypothetical protein
MNPTFCYVVESIEKPNQQTCSEQGFQCQPPGYALRKQASYWWSRQGGWAYPEIDGIPCLRKKHGVLMSHG